MSTGHCELQKVRNGLFLFHLKGNNSETILHSETFSSKASAENAITFARYVAPDETNYELKQNSDDAAYFVLRGKNQQIIGHSDPYNSLNGGKTGYQGSNDPRHHPGNQGYDPLATPGRRWAPAWLCAAAFIARGLC